MIRYRYEHLANDHWSGCHDSWYVRGMVEHLPVRLEVGEQVVVNMHVGAIRLRQARCLYRRPMAPVKSLLHNNLRALQDTKGWLCWSIFQIVSGRLPPAECDRKPRHMKYRIELFSL